MSELRDGFFYHPDSVAPLAQMQRLLVGEHNPAYDNLFSTTISEVDGEIGEVEAHRKKLLSQLVSLRKKLSSLRAHRAEITQAVPNARKIEIASGLNHQSGRSRLPASYSTISRFVRRYSLPPKRFTFVSDR